MLFQTTPEHEALRAKIRAFAEEEIKPIAFLLDQQNEFPEDAVRKLGEMGLMGIPYPKEYGGAGLDILSYAIAVEELARVDGGSGVILSAHVSLGSWPIFAFGTEAQKQKYLVPLAKGEKIGASCEEGYMPNGIRVNLFEKERGAKRAVNMLIAKINGKPFTTEYPMPDFDRVAPNPAVKDIAHAKIALVTSGGIVPKGNPDHIESSNATHYGKYDIEGVMDLTSEGYATAHGGYDPVYANADADRVLPVDVLREFEKEGKIGSLYRYFYTTVGNGTAVKSAKAFAAEFSKDLIADGVQAVILTST